MKKQDIFSFFFLVLISFFVMIFSYKYGLRSFRDPGPGLMPFLLGSLLLITSIWLILRSAFGMGGKAEIIEKEEEKGQIKLRRIIFILGSLFLYALFLETLGYLMTTSIFFIFLYRITGVKRWGPLLLATALTVSISYFGFTALGIIFPDGIIGRILTGR